MHFFQRIRDILTEERSRWFSFVPVLFGVGIGAYFALPNEPSIWITLGVVEAVLVAAYLLRFSKVGLFILLIFSFVVLGFACIQLKAHYLLQDHKFYDNDKMYLQGKIADVDHNFRGMPRLLLKDITDFDDGAVKGNIRLSLTSKKQVPEVGKCVEMIGVLRPPMKPVMVDGFDFGRKYFFDGIAAVGYSTGRAIEIDCENSSWTDEFSAKVYKMRMNIVGRINAILPADEAGITAAIVAGERNGISAKIYDDYRDAGLAHFISISGLHMTMVAAVMFFLVRFGIALIPPLALRYDAKKIAGVVAIVMSFVYLLISGMEIPAQRAFIMTLIVLVGVLVSRVAISMKTISWAALIILVMAPEVLVGPSFQMSFAAVMCLIAFYEKCSGSLSRFFKNNSMPWILKVILAYVVGILVADTIASMATLPFAIYHFKRVALYTTLGNLMAGPVIGLIIMPAVVLALLAMPFGLEYYPLKIAGFGIGKVNDITAYVAGLPEAGYQVLGMPTWGLVLIVLGGLWLCIWNKKWRHFGWIGIVVGALSMLTMKMPDVIVGEKTFAVKDNTGHLLVMPIGRGASFERDVWLEATMSKSLDKEQNEKLKKIFKGKLIDKDWVDLSCDESSCEYKGLVLNKENWGEARSVWLPGRVETVDEYVGDRLWVR